MSTVKDSAPFQIRLEDCGDTGQGKGRTQKSAGRVHSPAITIAMVRPAGFEPALVAWRATILTWLDDGRLVGSRPGCVDLRVLLSRCVEQALERLASEDESRLLQRQLTYSGRVANHVIAGAFRFIKPSIDCRWLARRTIVMNPPC